MDTHLISDNWHRLLTTDQQDFVQAMVVTRSLGAAADMAGISKVVAKRYAASPTIQAAIHLEQKKLRDECDVTPEEVISDLRLQRDMAFGRVPIPETKWVDGEPVTKYVRQYNAGAANKAIENLGRVIALFTDKKEISVPSTDEQLQHRLGQLLGIDIVDGEFVDVSDVEVEEESITTLANKATQHLEDELTKALVLACDENNIE